MFKFYFCINLFLAILLFYLCHMWSGDALLLGYDVSWVDARIPVFRKFYGRNVCHKNMLALEQVQNKVHENHLKKEVAVGWLCAVPRILVFCSWSGYCQSRLRTFPESVAFIIMRWIWLMSLPFRFIPAYNWWSLVTVACDTASSSLYAIFFSTEFAILLWHDFTCTVLRTLMFQRYHHEANEQVACNK